VTVAELGGAGKPIDLSQPFGIVLQHPVTSETADANYHMRSTLEMMEMASCGRSHLQTLCFWPGQEAGADETSKAVRQHQGHIHTVRSLPPARFLKLLTQCAVLVGNSSAGIREAGYLGTPVVDIGSRQFGRERGANVRRVSYSGAEVYDAIERQVAHGPYPSSSLYGTGNSGQQIAEILSQVGKKERTVCLSS
jgi:hypothetical protein